MQKLGRLLLEHGWVSDHQLASAIRRQLELGGRLGTCLLEMGAISEDLLLKVLAEQLGVTRADIEDLRDIPESVYGLLPAQKAIQYHAIPFRLDGRKADLAMLDTDNLQVVDELSFIVGRSINVHIANEARIIEALEKYYQHPRPVRFANLLDRLNRLRDQWRRSDSDSDQRVDVRGGNLPTSAPPARRVPGPLTAGGPLLQPRSGAPPDPPSSFPEPPGSNPAGFFRPRRDSSGAGSPPPTISLTRYERMELSSSLGQRPSAPTVPPPPSMPGDFNSVLQEPQQANWESAETQLESTLDPDRIGAILVETLAPEFDRVLLFRSKGDRLVGWMGGGPDLDPLLLEKYSVGFDEPSLFLNLRQGGNFFLGALPQMPPHVKLAGLWKGSGTVTCAAFPIRIRDKLTCVILGDRGTRSWGDLDLAAVQRLAERAAQALELCIVRRKMRRR